MRKSTSELPSTSSQSRKPSAPIQKVSRSISLKQADQKGARKISASLVEGPVSAPERALITNCWDNSKHSDIGHRIYLRVFDKRKDFHHMFEGPGREVWTRKAVSFTGFLERLVRRLDDTAEFESCCREFGAHHAELKAYGFKPDFWVTLADSMTTECLYLDEGMHQPAEVIGAWGALVAAMLTGMRDGYYASLRTARRLSKRHSRLSGPRPFEADGASSRSISIDESESLPPLQPLPLPLSPARKPPPRQQLSDADLEDDSPTVFYDALQSPASAIASLASFATKDAVAPLSRPRPPASNIQPPVTKVVNAFITRANLPSSTLTPT